MQYLFQLYNHRFNCSHFKPFLTLNVIFYDIQVAQKYDIPPEMIKAVYKKTKKGWARLYVKV